jgi:hypothetical protein
MADPAISASQKDDPNPFAPPRADFSDRSGSFDREAEELRRAHVRDESYVKALTIINFIYFLLYGASAAYYEWILISHLNGRVSAPWIVRPGFVLLQSILCSMPVLALGAAVGFLRRKRWALVLELLFTVCLFLNWMLAPLVATKAPSVLEFIATGAFVLAIAAPMLNVWDLRRSIVFAPEYDLAVAATPRVEVRPKLSGELKLITIVLHFVWVGLALVALS